MTDCIFCKIINDDIPATKIYEDDEVLAFLDINPVNKGHTLVIPKEHFENIYEIPDKTITNLMIQTKSLAEVVKLALKADGINIMMNNDKAAGQIVMHAHVHIVPRFEADGFKHWQGHIKPTTEDLEKTAGEIKSFLKPGLL